MAPPEPFSSLSHEGFQEDRGPCTSRSAKIKVERRKFIGRLYKLASVGSLLPRIPHPIKLSSWFEQIWAKISSKFFAEKMRFSEFYK